MCYVLCAPLQWRGLLGVSPVSVKPLGLSVLGVHFSLRGPGGPGYFCCPLWALGLGSPFFLHGICLPENTCTLTSAQTHLTACMQTYPMTEISPQVCVRASTFGSSSALQLYVFVFLVTVSEDIHSVKSQAVVIYFKLFPCFMVFSLSHFFLLHSGFSSFSFKTSNNSKK